MPDVWKPPPTLSVHQLEGFPVIGHAHGPKDTTPWSTRPGNRTRYSIHAVDTAQNKLLVSIGSVVLGGGTEYPHPQRGVTGWASLACFDLVLLTHLRTSGSYAGYQCHHHIRAYPEARPCWHCKARPPEARCAHFTDSQPYQTGPVRDAR
ncbi:hypothetical protein [Streptomyces sp. OM5714]|uniref:hypothetical protein n=1 Tax=Streptomyces sp. OM5714 TaxID=2602736 RepID=UPI0013DB6217|nr:hypothetical protein [Streptomyces sp. OM5714]KAF2774883.1 hypothetical protein STPH1_7070 [Streptomyces sp. OM5714]